MSDHLPVLILLAPLFGAVAVGLFGMREPRVCLPVTLAALGVSLWCAVGILLRIHDEGPLDYFVAGWEKPVGIGIVLRADAINSPFLLVIAVVAIFAALFAVRPTGERESGKTPHFFILFLLLCTGLFGITITGDAFNLFVLVEVSALSSYGLIAIGRTKRCKVAAFHYLIMGTVGASFYLIGVGYLYLKTGSLNMRDIHDILVSNRSLFGSRTVQTAFLFILIGIWTKMAFFPLHGWLANAYSYCPSSSACLLAPLSTKASVYVMIRIMVSVFGLDQVEANAAWGDLVVWLAVIAIAAGSTLALAQREFKKMLCFLIVAEVGYMVGGAWLGDSGRWGLTGSVYHLLADATMTSCLFLAAGTFAKHLGVVRIDDLSGLFSRMPLASSGFVIGALAMIGVPPTGGFFSKFYLIRGAIDAGEWIYIAALLGSSLVNAVLFFRLFEIAFFGKNPVGFHREQGPIEVPSERLEPPFHVLAPLLGAAALVILLGVFNGPIVEFIRTALLDPVTIVSEAR